MLSCMRRMNFQMWMPWRKISRRRSHNSDSVLGIEGSDQDGAFSDSSEESEWEPDEEDEDEDWEASPNGKLHQKKSTSHITKGMPVTWPVN